MSVQFMCANWLNDSSDVNMLESDKDLGLLLITHHESTFNTVCTLYT